MQLDGLNEFITVAKHWQRWSNPRLVVLVSKNRDLSYVTWEQRAIAGDIRFEASQDLPDVRYSEWGKLLGLGGNRFERPADVAAAWTEAFRAVKGDPDRATIIRQSFRDLVEDFVPHPG